jgi:hypothetical protein
MSPPVRDEGQDRAFELRSTLRLSRLAPCQPALIRSYPRACLSRCQSPRQKADFAAIRRSGGSVLWSLIAIKVHPMSLYRHRAAPARLGVRPRLGTLLRRQGALLLPRRPAGRRRRAPPARPRRQDLYPAPVALRLDRLAGGRDQAAHRGGRDLRTPSRRVMLVEAVPDEASRSSAFGFLHALDVGGGALAAPTSSWRSSPTSGSAGSSWAWCSLRPAWCEIVWPKLRQSQPAKGHSGAAPGNGAKGPLPAVDRYLKRRPCHWHVATSAG